MQKNRKEELENCIPLKNVDRMTKKMDKFLIEGSNTSSTSRQIAFNNVKMHLSVTFCEHSLLDDSFELLN